MPFQIIRNDITAMKADAIVNTANPKPLIGRGVDSAIYHSAGREALLAARKQIGDIPPGQARHTEAFGLSARYIIHTVGPGLTMKADQKLTVLRSCYRESLQLAERLSCESVAFPLLATGYYAIVPEEGLNIALEEIGKFLLTHEMDITLVVFNDQAFEISRQRLGEIRAYIDEHDVTRIREAEQEVSPRKSWARRAKTGHLPMATASPSPREESDRSPALYSAQSAPSCAPMPLLQNAQAKSLEDMLASKEASFQERLFELIEERGLDDVTVYKRANLDRKLFSSIRCKKAYKPKKKTAVALAIALHLDMPTMQDLLSRAELAVSPSNDFDLIISYFVAHENYDIYEINAALFEYGQPLLGA